MQLVAIILASLCLTFRSVKCKKRQFSASISVACSVLFCFWRAEEFRTRNAVKSTFQVLQLICVRLRVNLSLVSDSDNENSNNYKMQSFDSFDMCQEVFYYLLQKRLKFGKVAEEREVGQYV